MNKTPLFKLWLVSGAYILVLVLGFAFIFPNDHLPVLLELLFKGTAVLAFCMLLLVPALHVTARFHQGKEHPALTVGAGITAVGYALLFGQLVYVKLKTCDVNAVPYDSRWHCNFEGKSVIAYFVLVPILAAIVGIVVAGMCGLVRKRKATHEQ